MKILLIGHGRMGRLIEQTALAGGDSIGGIIDIGNLSDLETIGRVADVAVDFSAPAALPAAAHTIYLFTTFHIKFPCRINCFC